MILTIDIWCGRIDSGLLRGRTDFFTVAELVVWPKSHTSHNKYVGEPRASWGKGLAYWGIFLHFFLPPSFIQKLSEGTKNRHLPLQTGKT